VIVIGADPAFWGNLGVFSTIPAEGAVRQEVERPSPLGR
jgi:hypothetical protein